MTDGGDTIFGEYFTAAGGHYNTNVVHVASEADNVGYAVQTLIGTGTVSQGGTYSFGSGSVKPTKGAIAIY